MKLYQIAQNIFLRILSKSFKQEYDMSLEFNRRSFLKGASLMMGATALTTTGCKTFTAPSTNMITFSSKPLDKVKVAIIGVGSRGKGFVSRLSKIKDVEIVAISDLKEAKVQRCQDILKKAGRKPAKGLWGSPEAWKEIGQMDVDLVYIITPWEWHTPMAVYAMNHGAHAAIEIPVAKTIEESWELVETSERTQKHAIVLENCCYGFFELQTLNMVRQGVFGELTHAEGAYIHTLSGLIAKGYEGRWRLKENQARNGNLYPTHGLGPIAQCLNITRGNQFKYLTSMSSKEAAFSAWAKDNNRPDLVDQKYRGDMNTSLIKCYNGETIMLQHDVSTARPYSRIHLLQGTQGIARKWPERKIALKSHHNGHRWLNQTAMKDLEKQYSHPLIKTIGDVARKVGGHGGMDFIMDYRIIYCLKNGLPMDMNVYDGVTWSAIAPLSEKSVNNNSSGVKIPDFTQGKWRHTKPLAIVDVDPSKLKLIDKLGRAEGQLNV